MNAYFYPALRKMVLGGMALSVLASAPLRAEPVSFPAQPESPLTLSARGSFYVGGETVHQSYLEMGRQRPADTATVNQMYVEYMQPVKPQQPPVVMIHGAGQSGSAWDTTPDGRIGWYEYFVRQGYPTYVIDQVGRARSGFNQAVYNNVSAGIEKPASQPPIIRPGDEHALWINMRLGPKMGEPYQDSQFPVQSFRALSQMGIPDLSESVAKPNPTFRNLASLADNLHGAILISHSQSGPFPLETALINPQAVKAMVLIEPGTCENAKLTDYQVRKLSKIPMLIIYGDHLSASTELPGKTAGWMQRKVECDALVSRFNADGGQAAMYYLPSMGIHGNSHMIMQDKNSLHIADMVISWMKKSVINK